MSSGTLFYICGGLLAASAVVVSFIGLKVERFPGKAAPLVALWFIALIGCTTTLAVLHSQDEQKDKEAKIHKGVEEVENEENESLEAQ
ncbi:MAG TPA: hypothetical protein VH476_03825 [Solirubrobacterales bacterium]|jgi:hypothetical protein